MHSMDTGSWIPQSAPDVARWRLSNNSFVLALFGRSEGTIAEYGVWEMPRGDTTSGPVVFAAEAAANSDTASAVGPEIFEIRKLSGLTWDELANLFNVARRSVHLWANGKPINSANEMKVGRLLAAFRRMDRGEARENRKLIFSPSPVGGLMFDLLRRGDFDAFDDLVGEGSERHLPVGCLSPEAAAARRPQPVHILMDARADEQPVSRGQFVRAGRIRPRQRPDRD